MLKNNSKSKVNGAEATSGFALKAYLYQKPYQILPLGMIVSSVVLGFALRVLERMNDENSDFEYVFNGIWVVILAMTTSK